MLSEPCGQTVTLTIDGEPHTVPSGISVAAAMLSSGEKRCFCMNTPEEPREREARAPYCLMGVCFDCRAEIDGVPDRQTCLVEVAEGMSVRRTLPEENTPAQGETPCPGNSHEG